MKLLVVIVNYRTPDLTIDCLQALAREGTPPGAWRVTVVDNRSPDDSLARLRAAVAAHGWSSWVSIVASPHNGGFAYGNNQAIGPALSSADRPQYVLLLNSDTVVRPGAVAALVEFLDRRPDVGIVGSRLEDPDGTPQCSAYRFPSLRSEFAEAVQSGLVNRLFAAHVILPGIPDEASRTDWVAGASMLVRREVFEAIGLLDERFFMYYEETDFCLRAARAGFCTWYEPASRVVHLVGRSSGVTSRPEADRLESGRPEAKPVERARRPAYWFDSRRRYFVGNHGRAYTAAIDAAWSIGFVLRRLKERLLRRPDSEPPRLLADYLRHSVFVRGFSR